MSASCHARTALGLLLLSLPWGAALGGCADDLALPTRDATVDVAREAGVDDVVAASPDGAPFDPVAPRVRFTAPAEGSPVADDRLTLRGESASLSGVATVLVAVGPNAPLEARSTDGYRTWTIDALAPPGAFTAQAVAVDNTGRRSDAPAVLHLTRASAAADTRAPSIAVNSPADGAVVLDALALVRGTASDDRAVVRVEVRRDGVLLTDRPVSTDDFFGHWSRLVLLEPGAMNRLTFTAYDAAGHAGVALLTLQSRATVDRTAPTVEFRSHRDGAPVSTASLMAAGVAGDRTGVREVKLRAAAAPAPGAEPAWSEWVAAQTADGYVGWTATVPIPAGAVRVQARAINVNGIATSVTLALTNDFAPEWTPESAYPLRLRDGDPRASLRLELDRAGVNAVINPSIQQSTVLLSLDPTPLLTNALTAIKGACGTGWQADRAVPGFDCATTALGRTFVGADGTWRSSPEFALVRLLTMTPANVVVDGTSIAGLRSLADFLGLGGGFNQILADVLGIPRTREIISTASVVQSLRTRWMASHPAVGPSGLLSITLYDAMNDLAPLGTRFGPAAGGHPGVLDPSAPPRSVILQPGARLVLAADSNLRWLDGAVMARGKDYMAVVVDATGPTYDDVLEFDFTDPARFDITGLAPSPTVDLRLRINENARFIPSCNGDGACRGNTQAAPYGTGFVWSTPPWQLENIVSSVALNEYRGRTVHQCYLLCIASIDIGQGAPAGWTHFGVPLGIGSPPRDQYLWELIDEIAQVALHRVAVGGTTTSIAEGAANVAFTLQGIPVGLTADQIRTAVRPVLQAQSSTLSRRLLGDYAANNAPLDFFYRRGADGVPYVWFAAASDPRGAAGYRYARAGFFSDAALTARVSRADLAGSGDTAHEKLRLDPGETTVFAQDEAGATYRLRFIVTAGGEGEIYVAVSRRAR